MKTTNLQKMLSDAPFIPTLPEMSYEKLFKEALDGTVNTEQFRRIMRTVAEKTQAKKLPTPPMRRAMRYMNLKGRGEGLLNSIQMRNKPSAAAVMNAVFPAKGQEALKNTGKEDPAIS